jgi:hypothetical protein
MLYECPPAFKCNNQAITRFNPNDIPLHKVKTIDGRGYGVETSCDITKDQAIIEVTGRIVFEWKVSPCLLN